ncbi:hypothetical protein G7Y89_g1421 [Cudoniella acicularis]|uniref:NACHT domain-containing protein n=1 Tax=Cudoniella acicularis TaxID=354080 RepID=A0A8H4RY79_9HELO|nr:hypothetical protein G7Y89_g1421 [Cudoniella acicularis]
MADQSPYASLTWPAHQAQVCLTSSEFRLVRPSADNVWKAIRATPLRSPLSSILTPLGLPSRVLLAELCLTVTMSFGFSVGDFIAAIELANKIRKDFVGAPKHFKDVSDEVRGLSIILQDVDIVISEQELNDQQKKDLKDIIDACRNVLGELERTLHKYSELEPGQRGISQRVKRVWKRLTWEPDDVRELRSRITSNVTLLNSFSERFSRDNIVKLVQHQDDQERRAILDWLTPIDYAHEQNDFISRRQEGTGQWLLDSAEYQAWLKTSKQTLFCPGIPGAGKTILTSIVVSDLCNRFRGNGTIGIAYIYCNFRRQDEQKAESLLASLLRQLCQEKPRLVDNVKTLYDRHSDRRTRPLLDEILGFLQSVAVTYLRVFILVDALDECQISDGCRQRFLSGLFNLQSKCGVNLFATSRSISSIEEEFEGDIMLEIRASEEDVRRYLDGHMFQLPRFVVRSVELQEEIKTGIVKAVDGMFLLAQLHLESLTGKRAPKAVRAALKGLATGSRAYDHAYQDAMERINGQIKDQEELAKQVLSWITCAKRPLTTTELQHALGVEVGESELDEENFPQIEDIISICAGLVTVDKESSIIRLVHYTTQEYFNRTRDIWFPNTETYITTICVTYLSFNEFESGTCQNDKEFEGRLWSSRLYDYVSHNWGHHARKASTLIPEVISFLKKKKLTWKHRAKRYWLASFSGDIDVVKLLLDKGADTDLKDDRYGRTPLSRAVENGKEAIVKLLLATNSVEPDSKDRIGRTPLFYGVKNGNRASIELLLATSRVDVDSKDYYNSTSLSIAARMGHRDIVALLLARCCGFNVKDNLGRTPLWWSRRYAHPEITDLLLEKYRENSTTSQENDFPVTTISVLSDKGSGYCDVFLEYSGSFASVPGTSSRRSYYTTPYRGGGPGPQGGGRGSMPQYPPARGSSYGRSPSPGQFRGAGPQWFDFDDDMNLGWQGPANYGGRQPAPQGQPRGGRRGRYYGVRIEDDPQNGSTRPLPILREPQPGTVAWQVDQRTRGGTIFHFSNRERIWRPEEHEVGKELTVERERGTGPGQTMWVRGHVHLRGDGRHIWMPIRDENNDFIEGSGDEDDGFGDDNGDDMHDPRCQGGPGGPG